MGHGNPSEPLPLASVSALSLAMCFASHVFGTAWQHGWIVMVQGNDSFDSLITWVTIFGDPTNVFFRIVPTVLWAVDDALGVKLLSAVVISDCLNAMLKLSLRGNRPFWMHSDLRQFSVTCETGFGMPSGHVMVTTAVWMVLRRHAAHPATDAFVYLLIVAVALSRVHIAAHFIDQVVAGAACGVTVSRLVEIAHPPVVAALGDASRSLSRRFAIVVAAAAALGLGLLFEYWVVAAFVDDPFASVTMALRGCHDASKAHRTTGPLVGLLRDLGVLVGGGAALVVRRERPLPHAKVQLAIRVLAGLALLGGLRDVLSPPHNAHGELVFRIHAFVSFTIYGFAMLCVIPEVLHRAASTFAGTQLYHHQRRSS